MQPAYILAQNKKRVLIPKIFTLLLLGIIFYVIVLLNFSLLKLTAATEETIKLTSLITLSILIILGIILNFKKANQTYQFYQDRIIFNKKEVLLQQITKIQPKQNLFDKLFKTQSLILTDKFKINNIPQQLQIQNYLQKLINYQTSRY